jgi:putative Ca2+/H+ antiporter (TMEM165/GDT1 family)
VPTSSESTTNPLIPEIAATATAPNRANSVFISTFITIFLAEMGDKTQLATLLMTAQSHAPLSVLLGSGLALIATSLIGVLLGRWLSKVVAPETLDILAAVLMLVIAVLLLGEVVEL